MEIKHSYHVRKRARERVYTLDEVDAVVRDHLSSWPDKKHDSLVLTGSPGGGRRLRVCLVHPPVNDGEVFVKTAWWLDDSEAGRGEP